MTVYSAYIEEMLQIDTSAIRVTLPKFRKLLLTTVHWVLKR